MKKPSRKEVVRLMKENVAKYKDVPFIKPDPCCPNCESYSPKEEFGIYCSYPCRAQGEDLKLQAQYDPR